jgi:hypothetical protein
MGSAPAGHPIVYLGPSLPRSRARAILDADYRPPVKRGDLPARHAGTIVILDGEFGQSLSVSPKEILRLLDDGTTVIGAASMGALRALELNVYGMRGCGWVFDAYRSGQIDADDEVAIRYSPEDLGCLTVPLVNVRAWLAELTLRGSVDPTSANELLDCAARQFYADRSETSLLAAWRQLVGPEELRRLLDATGGTITDIKAADAERALVLAGSIHNTDQQEDDDGREAAEPDAQRGVLQGGGRR